jgi:nucleoside 2-deoxyribosyltransferase
MNEIDLLVPPAYCHYAGGPCDQELVGSEHQTVFFVYPSRPEPIAATVEAAAVKLERSEPTWSCITWKQLPVAGRSIFCEICKAIRRSVTVVADVTTLNFNLLFEIGFIIGLGVPVIPIRDTSYQADRRAFEELGLLDTLGYVDFTNSEELQDALVSRVPGYPLAKVPSHEFRDAPLYVLKGPIETEGAIHMMSALKKSAIKFRTYDPVETPRLSMHEARRQVSGSTAVIANLLARNGQRPCSIMVKAPCFAASHWLKKKPSPCFRKEARNSLLIIVIWCYLIRTQTIYPDC